MHEFGSSGLVTGYIKQLLATFELPTTRIYSQEFARYFEEHGKESPYIIESFDESADRLSKNIPVIGEGKYDNLSNDATKKLQVSDKLLAPYIKDGRVQFYLGGYYTSDNTYVPGKWQSDDLDVNKPQGGLWNIYNRGSAYLNQTKRLQIRNNIYDSYTHEYLGNYLRFLRDYDGLDLMSLYNCFSNRLCTTTAGLDLNVLDLGDTSNKATFGKFSSLDNNYKVYLVPVKLFKNYTIAIDSAFPVEMCCGIYNNTLNIDKEEYQELLQRTYTRFSDTAFNRPFLYTALTDLAPKELSNFPTSSEIHSHSQARKFITKIADRESNLVLLLKVHKDVHSSITILEGDYRGWNDFSAKLVPNTTANLMTGIEKKILLTHNRTVLTNEAIYSETNLPLISSLQLLQLNTGKHMPFADRLLEYLLDMCITGSQNEPRENVLMAQQLLGIRHDNSSIPTRYYILSDSKGVKYVVFADRQFCTTDGDLYLDAKNVIYKFSKSGPSQDTKVTDAVVVKGDYSDPFISTPLAIDQNLQNGVWHDSLRKLFYQYMTNSTEHNFVVHRDLLGYVDKDVEKYFVAFKKDKKSGKIIRKSMLNFDAWEDIEE